jgi:hypothetical protein
MEFLRDFWCSCFIVVSGCGCFVVVVFGLEVMVEKDE